MLCYVSTRDMVCGTYACHVTLVCAHISCVCVVEILDEQPHANDLYYLSIVGKLLLGTTGPSANHPM